MRVLMFGWEFPPFNSGGLGVACYGLARALVHEGVEITFVLPKKYDVSVDFLKLVFADASKIKIRKVDTLLNPYLTSDLYTSLKSRYPFSIYGSSLFDEVARYALAAKKIAQEEEFDIIHAHDWLSFDAGVAAKEVSGKQLVVHVHATEFDRTGGNNINKVVYEIEKEGMKLADTVLAVSNFTGSMIISHYGISPSKVRVVHNGITPQDYEIPTTYYDNLKKLKKIGNKIVLFVGRLTLQKGPDYFLRGAKKVLEFNPKVIFLIAGSGDMERKIIEEAAELGISDKVLFTGFLRGDELNRVYRSADLFVMPSVSEPFGITALESLINGTPVLISKQSGVSEVLKHALKTDFWDVDDIASKMLAVIDHKSLRDCLAQNGLKEVKGITWQEAAKKCIEIYKEILKK